MSQYDFGTINPATKSGTDLASDLNSWRTAINSSHKGATAPSYRIAGTVWLDDAGTPWLDKIYDGADWIVRGSVNASTNAYTPYLAGVAIGNSSTSAVGLVELATSAEVLAMSSTSFAVTPSGIGALFKQGSTLTAANALSIGSGNGGLFEVDGATDVHSISDAGGPGNGRTVVLRFIHATPGLLRHNVSGTERVFLPGAVDIDIKQFDIFALTRLGANWHLTGYIPYAGLVLADQRLGYRYIEGCELSNNGTDALNDIDISVGECRDDAHTVDMGSSAILTKRLDATWAVGSGNGGIDTGAKAAASWYHVWRIKRLDTGVVDAIFTLNAGTPSMPTNYTKKKRLGSVLTDGSSNILAFLQHGGDFIWKTPIQNDNTVNALGSAARQAFVVSTPLGIITRAKVRFYPENITHAIYFSESGQVDVAASSGGPLTAQMWTAGGVWLSPLQDLEIWTDTSSQIFARSTAANTNTDLATAGWYDPRI